MLLIIRPIGGSENQDAHLNCKSYICQPASVCTWHLIRLSEEPYSGHIYTDIYTDIFTDPDGHLVPDSCSTIFH